MAKRKPKRVKVKCPLCDFTTDNVHTLFGHMISTHCDEEGFFYSGEPPKPKYKYLCDFCGEIFSSEDEMLRHLVTEHPEELKQKAGLTDEQIEALRAELGIKGKQESEERS